MPIFTYAGIGARETPSDVLNQMSMIARELAEHSWNVRSGGAKGADTAFTNGISPFQREIHLPWSGYNGLIPGFGGHIVPPENHETHNIAAKHHPNWANLSRQVRLFMTRNVTIVLGANLNQPADMIICWTPNGALVGGTSHAIKVGASYGIPTFNLALPDTFDKLIQFVRSKEPAS